MLASPERRSGHGHHLDFAIGVVAGEVEMVAMTIETEPSPSIPTIILAVIGSIVVRDLAQSFDLQAVGRRSGIIGCAVGAIIVLVVSGFTHTRL